MKAGKVQITFNLKIRWLVTIFVLLVKKTALMSIQKVFSENLKFRSKASSLWRNFIQIAASMSISWKVLI